MTSHGRNAYIEQFQRRLVADAMQEATAAYWRRRAAAFDAATPRPEDFRGQASPQEIKEQQARLRALAEACRHRAVLADGWPHGWPQ